MQNLTQAPAGRQGASAHTLRRVAFRVPRDLEFFSPEKLSTRIGMPRDMWLLAIAKELVDNGLDICEEHKAPPVISVAVDRRGITVHDSGPGIPPKTLEGVLDFNALTSSRALYKSPTRGAQGNALKTMVALPWVLGQEEGSLQVTACGLRHTIRYSFDRIARQINSDGSTEVVNPTSGTEIRLEWGDEAWPFDPQYRNASRGEHRREEFRHLLERFALFNPHATIHLDWFGVREEWPALDSTWKKWRPSDPTSAHWYNPNTFDELVCAYLASDRESGVGRLVSEFVGEFDGFKRSDKRSEVLEKAGLKRAQLTDLLDAEGKALDGARVAGLLAAMQAASEHVSPKRLGVLGEAAFRGRFAAMGIRAGSFRYASKKSGGPIPWVLEAAFGQLVRGPAWHDRRLHAGVNWSAAVENPFRSFGGPLGHGLDELLTNLKADSSEPIVFAIHLACPLVAYTDPGKTSVRVG